MPSPWCRTWRPSGPWPPPAWTRSRFTIPQDWRTWDVTVRGAPALAATLAAAADQATLFRTLATLVADADLGTSVDDLRWSGPTAAFRDVAAVLGDPGLATRADRVAARR